jgi:7-carboxy-7-deazaguanine synthase
MSEVLISEMFGPTVQGEGAAIGTPTVFVRTGGCDYLCSWCDTLYAVEKQYRRQWLKTSSQDILAKVRELSQEKPLLVTLSGGNPALQPLGELIEAGQALGYTFALETQGSVAQDWFSLLDILTLSPKPPSSGMAFNAEKLNDCIQRAGSHTAVGMKIVVQDETDLEWAAERRAAHPDIPLVLQPCNPHTEGEKVDVEGLNTAMRWLVDEVVRRQWHDVRVLPQLHVQLWGNTRGV